MRASRLAHAGTTRREAAGARVASASLSARFFGQIPKAACLWILLLSRVAFTSAGEAPAAPPPRVYVLASDERVLSGTIRGFEKGFLLLAAETCVWEISPQHILGIFATRAMADKARRDPEYLASLLDSPPEPEPADPEPLPDPAHEPPEPKPEPVPSTAPKPPPGGSEHEKRYWAREAPAEGEGEARFFEETVKGALRIAKAYADAGELVPRLKTLRTMASGLNRNPKMLLDASQYKPALLVTAMTLTHGKAKVEEARTSRNRLENMKQAMLLLGVVQKFYRGYLRTLDMADMTPEDRKACHDRFRYIRDTWGMKARSGDGHGAADRRPGARVPRREDRRPLREAQP